MQSESGTLKFSTILKWTIIVTVVLNSGNTSIVTVPNYDQICLFDSKNVICGNRSIYFELTYISKKAEIIVLSNSHLQELDPKSMRKFKNLRYLQVSNNEIANLRKSFKSNRKLEFIDVSCNRLGTDVMGADGTLKRAFSRNKLLQSLNISHNRIREISNSMMGKTKRHNLTLFDASHNLIRIIKKNTLRSFKKLRKLNLSHNDITFIDKDSFQRNSNLLYMTLNGNRISFVGRNYPLDLTHNKELQQFLVMDNRLECLCEINFSKNANLEEINMAQNKLRRISRKDLWRNEKLIHLNFSKNHIRTVQSGSFQNLRNLRSLDLSDNLLRQIHKRAFQNLTNLTVLSLSYNLISILHPDTFTGNVRLVQLDLTGNLFQQRNSGFLQSVGGLVYVTLRLSYSVNLKYMDLTK